MFLIIGITDASHDIGLRKFRALACCGIYGASAAVTCVYRQFMLFFLPLFQFGKRYYITCPNCGTVYEISKEEGRRLEHDPNAEINPDRMYVVQQAARGKVCPVCRSTVDPNARYCPNCGTKL
ncbi:MAG TPA: zinc ribbon domain-containing protein [Caproiciproducens sp.]|nr:zinc ribbon domain-containing protein [Caproiciproducens sp.]